MAACGSSSGYIQGDPSEPQYKKTVFFPTEANTDIRDFSSVSPQPEGKETFSAEDAQLFLNRYNIMFDAATNKARTYTDRGSFTFEIKSASKLSETTKDGKKIIKIDYTFENNSSKKESPDAALRWVFYGSTSSLPGSSDAKSLASGTSTKQNDVPIFALKDVESQILKAPDDSQFTSADPQVKAAQEPKGDKYSLTTEEQKTVYSSLFVVPDSSASVTFSLVACTNGKGLTSDIYCRVVQPLEGTIQ